MWLSAIVKLTTEAGFEGEPIRPAESGIRLFEGIRERYIEQREGAARAITVLFSKMSCLSRSPVRCYAPLCPSFKRL